MAENAHSDDIPEPTDPSLKNGHKVLLYQRTPIELRVQEEGEPSQVGRMLDIDCKLLVKYNNDNLFEVRLELTTEVDLFFNYTHFLNPDTFRSTQKNHKLMVSLNDYPDMMKRLLVACLERPQEFICIFVMRKNGWARLDFVQNLKCKFLELLTCEFAISKHEQIRENVTYRNQLVQWQFWKEVKWATEVRKFIKHNCPSVLFKVFPGRAETIKGI